MKLNEISKPKQIFLLSKFSYNIHQEYKLKFQRKSLVCEILFTNEKILISLKNEKLLNQLLEVLECSQEIVKPLGKHQKNRSCEILDFQPKQSTHSNNGRKCLHSNYHTNVDSFKIHPEIQKNVSIDCLSKTPAKKIRKNEANTSISQIILDNMDSSKNLKMKSHVSDSFMMNDSFSNMIEISYTNNSSNIIQTKTQKRIGKIIKLNLPSSNITPAKSNSSFNLQDELFFPVEDDDVIKTICSRIENSTDYIYDSFILKSLLKSMNLKKSDLGTIFSEMKKDYLKSFLLTEMIAITSKKILSDSILKSQGIVLREKEINSNYFVQSTNQHSIEYCIIDLFNTLLGSNRESDEFYTKILPNLLCETFKIDFIYDLRTHISIPHIFVSMQYHNRIYFIENVDINFNDHEPFVTQDIKYISPYYINKWYKKASEDLCKKDMSNPNSYTNIKRMKFNNFEMRDSVQKMCKEMKANEKINDENRVLVMKSIYWHLFNKQPEIAHKLCDHYLQKFAETIFLNPLLYLILSEIYNESQGVELSRLFFEKAVTILEWQFPKNDNPLIVDIFYTFSLILMKQPDVSLFFSEIEELLEKSKLLCKKFFNDSHEKTVKINLQLILVKFAKYEGNDADFDPVLDDLDKNLEYLSKSELFREESIYLNLFIDMMKNIHTISEEKKIKYIQR